MVTIDQLRALYYAEPFKPFVLVLEDGRRVQIDDPGYISYSSETRTLVFPLGRTSAHTSFDRVRVEPAKPRRRTQRRKAS